MQYILIGTGGWDIVTGTNRGLLWRRIPMCEKDLRDYKGRSWRPLFKQTLKERLIPYIDMGNTLINNIDILESENRTTIFRWLPFRKMQRWGEEIESYIAKTIDYGNQSTRQSSQMMT